MQERTKAVLMSVGIAATISVAAVGIGKMRPIYSLFIGMASVASAFVSTKPKPITVEDVQEEQRTEVRNDMERNNANKDEEWDDRWTSLIIE